MGSLQIQIPTGCPKTITTWSWSSYPSLQLISQTNSGSQIKNSRQNTDLNPLQLSSVLEAIGTRTGSHIRPPSTVRDSVGFLSKLTYRAFLANHDPRTCSFGEIILRSKQPKRHLMNGFADFGGLLYPTREGPCLLFTLSLLNNGKIMRSAFQKQLRSSHFARNPRVKQLSLSR